MIHLTTQKIIDWATKLVTASSLVLLGLHWFEGVLEVWLPRDLHPWIWGTYDKVLLTVTYVSISSQRKTITAPPKA